MLQEKPIESLASVRSSSGSDIHVDIRSWLANDPKASFGSWKTRMPAKASEIPTTKKKKEEGKVTVKDKDRELEKRVVKVKFLMEKYGGRWLNVIRSSESHFHHASAQTCFETGDRAVAVVACFVLPDSGLSSLTHVFTLEFEQKNICERDLRNLCR